MKATTARGVLSTFGTMLGTAMREGLISVNPAIGARRPRGGVKRLEPYTTDELARVIGHAAKGDYTGAPIVALLAGVGCRVGEAFGLDVGDLYSTAGTIHNHQTYDNTHGLGATKSPYSVRTVRVPAQVLPLLVIAAGSRSTGPLFQTSGGKRYALTYLRRTWFRICRDLELETRKPHQLRHSVATALISAQVPLGDVAKLLGDRVEAIVKTYLHPTGVDPTDALERLLGGRKVESPPAPAA
jgi:integrase